MDTTSTVALRNVRCSIRQDEKASCVICDGKIRNETRKMSGVVLVGGIHVAQWVTLGRKAGLRWMLCVAMAVGGAGAVMGHAGSIDLTRTSRA